MQESEHCLKECSCTLSVSWRRWDFAKHSWPYRSQKFPELGPKMSQSKHQGKDKSCAPLASWFLRPYSDIQTVEKLENLRTEFKNIFLNSTGRVRAAPQSLAGCRERTCWWSDLQKRIQTKPLQEIVLQDLQCCKLKEGIKRQAHKIGPEHSMDEITS